MHSWSTWMPPLHCHLSGTMFQCNALWTTILYDSQSPNIFIKLPWSLTASVKCLLSLSRSTMKLGPFWALNEPNSMPYRSSLTLKNNHTPVLFQSPYRISWYSSLSINFKFPHRFCSFWSVTYPTSWMSLRYCICNISSKSFLLDQIVFVTQNCMQFPTKSSASCYPLWIPCKSLCKYQMLGYTITRFAADLPYRISLNIKVGFSFLLNSIPKV